MMRHVSLTSLLLLMLLAIPCPAQQPEPLTNNSVIQMAKAGLGDSLIIQSINMAPSSFSVTTSDLITLKKAGVSERVIGAMLAKSGVAPDVSSPVDGPDGAAVGHSMAPSASKNGADGTSLAGVDEVGVYYKARDGQWTAMEPELVNFRSGGALKSYSTNGIIKQDRNGHIMGPVGAAGADQTGDLSDLLARRHVSHRVPAAETSARRAQRPRVPGTDGRDISFHNRAGTGRGRLHPNQARPAHL